MPYSSDNSTQRTISSGHSVRLRGGVTLLFVAVSVFLFNRLLSECVLHWRTEPQCAFGVAVPLAAAGLIWQRRTRMAGVICRCSRVGLAVLLSGAALQLTAVALQLTSLEAAAFLTVQCGIVMFVWGRGVFSVVWPCVLFMGFMLPLPAGTEHFFSGTMQQWGADEAAWYLQAFGIPAVAEQHDLLLAQTQLRLADTFSGIRMLMLHLAVAAAAIMVSSRNGSDKLLVLFSAGPIAMLCNTALVVTAGILLHNDSPSGRDFLSAPASQWLLLLSSIGLVLLELRLVDWLFVTVRDDVPEVMLPRAIPGIVPARKSQSPVC
jgi:exosortase